MPDFNPEDAGNILTLLLVYGGVVLAAFWLAMMVWTFRDMRARSRDKLAQFLVTVMVGVLTFPGLLIYILLRPRETLSEAYERSLEEEALLQEIEEKPTCPGCGQRTHGDWQICPNCQTRLKKPCIGCGRMLELSWNICPHCATAQAVFTQDPALATTSYASAAAPAGTARARRRTTSPGGSSMAVPTGSSGTTSASGSGGSLEFIDGEDYR